MSDHTDPQQSAHHATADPRTGDQAHGASPSDAKDPQHHDHHATLDPRYGDQPHDAPLASGSPEPGSGHDDSQTVTTDAGPPVEPTDGVPGATGIDSDDDDHAEMDRS